MLAILCRLEPQTMVSNATQRKVFESPRYFNADTPRTFEHFSSRGLGRRLGLGFRFGRQTGTGQVTPKTVLLRRKAGCARNPPPLESCNESPYRSLVASLPHLSGSSQMEHGQFRGYWRQPAPDEKGDLQLRLSLLGTFSNRTHCHRRLPQI